MNHFIVLLPTQFTGAFIAWGERLSDRDTQWGRVAVHQSWGLRQIAPPREVPGLRFDQWNENGNGLVLEYLKPDQVGTFGGGIYSPVVLPFEVDNQAIAQAVFQVYSTSLQFFLSGVVSRANLSKEQQALLLDFPQRTTVH